MRKLVLIFGLICMFINVSLAQDCPFKVSLDVIDATCFYNGKIVYYVVDAYGNPISESDLNNSTLSRVRVYTKVNDTDSANYSGRYYKGGVDTFQIDYGTYIVGVEGVCEDGHGGYFKVDTETVMTINTSYIVPKISTFFISDSSGYNIGRHPTLRCDELGRLQVRIEDGKFPYTLQVMAHGTTDTLRTLVFNDFQYDGTDSSRYDYWKYFSLDTMPAGYWDIYMQDGCGYGLPRTGQVVEVTPFPYLDYLEIYASSGNVMDSNVVKINVVVNSPYDYYTAMIPEHVQYRFTYDNVPNGDWKPFPALPSNHKLTFFDTLDNASTYCQFWNKEIGLQYKIEGTTCSDSIITRTFEYYKPNETNFEKTSETVKDSMVDNMNVCKDSWYWHRKSYSIRYKNYSPNNLRKDMDDNIHRYHYTHPLTWVYKDENTGNIIKRDTVETIATWSALYDTEVEEIYGPLPQQPRIKRTLLDGHGCELYTTTDRLDYIIDDAEQETGWSMRWSGNDHCCDVFRTITVNGNFSELAHFDGTKIRLVTSPYNNRYNFEAEYQSETNTWHVIKSHMQNVADINGASNGRSLEVRAKCLPSGRYTFEIQSPCDTVTLSQRISFPDIYHSELVADPVYTLEKECTDWIAIYTDGKLARVRYNTDPNTGLDLPPVVDTLPTYFQVIKGPAGGFDSRWYSINDPIRLPIPGTYVVKIFSETSVTLCDSPVFYDTISFSNTTVQYVYAYALLCDERSTRGNVYVKGSDGTQPYTYTLFSRANRQGEILGINNTGVFNGVPLRTDSALSCLIIDACGASFHVNFFPLLLADLQVTWFDGGLKSTTTCEGSTITVHTLQSDNLMNYTWTGPNGFYVENTANPYIFIPRGADNGWYKVTVRERVCRSQVTDSIYLGVKRAPMVTIEQNTSICPGEMVSLTFTPTSYYVSDNVEFSIVYKNETKTEIRHYSSPSGVSVTDTFYTLTPAKIFPLIIQDDECGYEYADPGDTTYISIKSNVIDPCNIFTKDDKVCYQGTGHLEAKATIDVPYFIRWYSDFNQTVLLKEDTITDPDAWAYYDTTDIVQRTILYVTVDKDGYCPSVHGVATSIITMQPEQDVVTHVNCNQAYRVYDSGGETGDYGIEEYSKQTFVTTDGRQLILTFEELDLSSTAHLFVISGTELLIDSLIVDLTDQSPIPEMLVSNGNALTLYFMSGMVSSSGWSALVEPEPGIAIADVYAHNHNMIFDEICQSQHAIYTNPLNIPPEVATMEEMNEAIKRSGTHIFTHTYPNADRNNCDSTVSFVLTVTSPPFVDTTVVTSNFQLNGSPYHWHGHDYTETGRYSIIYTMEDGCDSLDILNLIILKIDTSKNEICIGSSTVMGISVETPHLQWREGEIPAVNAPGDVLCTDGSILRPDSFLLSGKTAMGVVYFLDRTGQHGKAVALEDAPTNYAIWARGPVESIHAKQKCASQRNALMDVDGMGNTQLIKYYIENTAGMTSLEYNSPAVYYCYHYDAMHHNVNPSQTSGWYLPSMGELNLVFGNRVAVNATLKKLSAYGGQVFDSGTRYYLSSTEANDKQCWHNDYSGHFVTNYKTDNNNLRIRPSIDF